MSNQALLLVLAAFCLFAVVWVAAIATFVRAVRDGGGRLTISLMLALTALAALLFGAYAVAVGIEWP
jgi:hypothetical protein